MAAYRDPERTYREHCNYPSRKFREPAYVEEMRRRRQHELDNSVTSQSSSQVERGWVNDPRYKHKFVFQFANRFLILNGFSMITTFFLS